MIPKCVNRASWCVGVCGGLLLAAQGGWALPVDKAIYSISNPTPKKYMREMSTDRPDQTESPYTVDAGHIQIEKDTISGTWDHNRAGGLDQMTREMVFGNANIKIGLTNTIDLQIMAAVLTTSHIEDRLLATNTDTSGVGELTTRLKINLWGNDGGTDACAIMPYIKWPLPKSELRNGQIEGGLILPYSVALNETQSLGVMAQVDVVNSDTDGVQMQYLTTATFGQSLSDKIGGYVEVATRFIPKAECQAQLDFGITYRPSEDMQLDVGASVGITREAPDVVVFSGITCRY